MQASPEKGSPFSKLNAQVTRAKVALKSALKSFESFGTPTPMKAFCQNSEVQEFELSPRVSRACTSPVDIYGFLSPPRPKALQFNTQLTRDNEVTPQRGGLARLCSKVIASAASVAEDTSNAMWCYRKGLGKGLAALLMVIFVWDAMQVARMQWRQSVLYAVSWYTQRAVAWTFGNVLALSATSFGAARKVTDFTGVVESESVLHAEALASGDGSFSTTGAGIVSLVVISLAKALTKRVCLR